MKSDDYKRGVRDMAAAMEKVYPFSHLAEMQLAEVEQRLLADPVPKFAAGQIVMLLSAAGPFKIKSWSMPSSGTSIIYFFEGEESDYAHHERQLRALTPLEATGKE